MTVSTSTRRVDYAGNGVTTVFPVPFRFLAATDLRVILATAAGVETVQTLNVNYTAAGANDVSGGSITMTAAPGIGTRLVIKRNTTRLQGLDFTPFDPFPAEAQERALDRSILIDQEAADEQTRAIMLPETDALAGQMILPAAAARTGRVLGFDNGARPAAGPLLDQINTLIATAFTPGMSGMGAAVSFLQAGTGAVARNVQDKERERVSVRDFGAAGSGSGNDAPAFVLAGNSAFPSQVEVPAGAWAMASTPAVAFKTTWIVDRGATFPGAGKLSAVSDSIVSYGGHRSIESDPGFYNGIFGYLEQNAAISAYGTIGLHGVARSAGGSGGAGEADIGVAAFGLNDQPGVGGVWGLYSTVVRSGAGGINGATHGLEIDVANFGSTVELFPALPFVAGNTNGIWLCAGGETTEPTAGGSPGIVSVALAIIQNDSQASKTAKFGKGIMFHNAAIAGTDGATGTGVAMAFATGHSMVWFNNSNQAVAEISVSGRTFASNNLRMDFSDFGILFQDRASGVNAFAVAKVASMVNGLTVTGSITGAAPILSANGADANIDIELLPKGSGQLRYGTWTSNGDAAVNGYITIRDDNTGTIRKLATIA